jgi:signal transduction histidine kinase
VLAGTAAWQVVGSSGVSELIVGVPIHAQTASRTENAAYFEIFDLSDLTRTLHALLAALALAALITTVAGAVLGRWASARTLRPLRETTQAALAIAGGRLGTRLESADFADLAPFASAFNQMVDQLQERIEREARFTSDVNHELRSPLTTLANSLSVLEARRDELPPRALQALDLLGAEVRRFRRLVDELLEISRIDAKPDDISRDEVTIGSLVEHTVQATGTNVPTQFGPGVASQHILVDKRRFERIFANLFENAQRYAGGVTLLAIEDHGDTVRFLVEDAGPGIAPEERDRIFERFSRGSTGRRRGLGDGTGLGLAIVAQHVNQHGGRVWVEERLGGGSRFVVELPAWSEVVT